MVLTVKSMLSQRQQKMEWSVVIHKKFEVCCQFDKPQGESNATAFILLSDRDRVC